MKNDELEYWSLLRVSEALRRKELTSVAVTEAMLARIAKLDGTLRSYRTVMAEQARAQAAAADKEIAAGKWRGPLHGVPVAVKDLCFTSNAPTSAGMNIYKDKVPDYDATVVRKLNDAGAVLLGKLHMTEAASLMHHPALPRPLNPWSADHWTGISSSGSGVATAAGLCYAAIGSDTGGSIRFPSSSCGLTGIKPTYGRVSRHGIFPLSESMDHVGPMARSAADAAAMLGVIAGEDAEDPTTSIAPVPDYLAELAQGIRGLRIGVDSNYTYKDVDAEIVAAVQAAEKALTSAGAKITPMTFPPLEDLLGTLSAMGFEIADSHRATYPARASEYGPELATMLASGHKAEPLAVAAALRERRNFTGRVQRIWKDVDLLLIPALAIPVPTAVDMETMGTNHALIGKSFRFTVPFNITGNPTITLPCGVTKLGLPIGLQLVGPHLSEALLCRAGHAFQQATDWHTRHPNL
jgi:amidase